MSDKTNNALSTFNPNELKTSIEKFGVHQNILSVIFPIGQGVYPVLVKNVTEGLKKNLNKEVIVKELRAPITSIHDINDFLTSLKTNRNIINLVVFDEIDRAEREVSTYIFKILASNYMPGILYNPSNIYLGKNTYFLLMGNEEIEIFKVLPNTILIDPNKI